MRACSSLKSISARRIVIPEIVANNGTFSEERGWRLTFADLPPCQHFSSATGIPMPAFTEDVWIPPLLWLGFAENGSKSQLELGSVSAPEKRFLVCEAKM